MGKAETLTECPRCGVRYLASDPVLQVKHATCSPDSAEREARAFWRTVQHDLDRRKGE